MIQNSAMLIDLNISVWTGRKMDKKVSDEIDVAKNTKGRAGNYHKALLGNTGKLADLQKLVSAIRIWHYEQTLPWSDGGSRLLPMANFFAYKATLAAYEVQFTEAVAEFLTEYPTLVSAAAFQLGDLFDSEEYPAVSKLEDKFRMKYVFLPVPSGGDFRIDVSEAGRQELKSQYEQFYNDRVNDAMKDVWDRLHTCVKHLSDKLADSPTPRVTKEGLNHTQIFRDSLVTNANELCDLLSKLNVTNDHKLEMARQSLERAINGNCAEDLRNSDELRLQTKAKVDEILGMFD
jgi:hypothetical protein